MKRFYWLLLLGIGMAASQPAFAQETDTLVFFSKAFGQERTIYVTAPADFKYQSAEVKLPVVYVLDGQHEWFVDPVTQTIKNLKTTYEVPNTLTVVIPHVNRYVECPIPRLDGPELPLHTFILKEVEEQIQRYAPGDYRMIVGHSYSASFALYSFLRGEGFYSVVVAHTPMNKLDSLAHALDRRPNSDATSIVISTGSMAQDKDMHHRVVYEEAKKKHPDFFARIMTIVAEESTHNAVPIVATPVALTRLFYDFSRRFGKIPEIDAEYKLVSEPGAPEAVLAEVRAASRIGKHFYPPEIAEINGIASRFLNNGYYEHAAAIFEEGIKYYPAYYDFHINLYSLYLEKDKNQAKTHLLAAYDLVNRLERNEPGWEEILAEIAEEIKTNGW